MTVTCVRASGSTSKEEQHACILLLLWTNLLRYRDRQQCEMQKMREAHSKQLVDFNMAWDSYLEEYDTIAQGYVKEFTER